MNEKEKTVLLVDDDQDLVAINSRIVGRAKLNTLRRNIMNQLEDDQKKELKGKRFVSE